MKIFQKRIWKCLGNDLSCDIFAVNLPVLESGITPTALNVDTTNGYHSIRASRVNTKAVSLKTPK